MLLRRHLDHILRNRFRAQLGLGDPVSDPGPAELLAADAVRAGRVLIDGSEREGWVSDADPFVVSWAAVLDGDRVLTAVVPREFLPLIEPSFLSDAG